MGALDGKVGFKGCMEHVWMEDRLPWEGLHPNVGGFCGNVCVWETVENIIGVGFGTFLRMRAR